MALKDTFGTWARYLTRPIGESWADFLDSILPLAAGSGSPLTGDLYIDAASNPSIFLREGGSATSYTMLQDTTANNAIIRKYAATGHIYFDIDGIVSDGTSNVNFRFFRNLDSTGSGYVHFLKGDGTTTIQHYISSNGTVYFCQQAGEVTIQGGGTLNLEAASGPSYLHLAAGGSATDYAEIYQFSNKLDIRMHNDGTAYIYVDPIPDATSEAVTYLFQNTSTSGAVYLDIAQGDGTSTSQHRIEGDTGNVNLCKVAGTLTVGDGTDGVTADRDGVYLKGTATMWDDLRVPALATRVPAAGGPGFAQFKDNGAASQGVFIYWFSPTTEEEVYFVAQMPHNWAEGTDIEPHVHWVSADTAAGAGTDVCWGLEYTWSDINEVFGNTTIIYADEQTNGATETLTVDKHYLTDFAAITGTGHTMSSMLVCRLFRDAAGVGGTDDYDDDAGFLEFDFHYQINSLGSKEEYVKGP